MKRVKCKKVSTRLSSRLIFPSSLLAARVRSLKLEHHKLRVEREKNCASGKKEQRAVLTIRAKLTTLEKLTTLKN